MEQEFYIPKLGLIPMCIRPVRPVADQYDRPVTDQYDLCWRAKLLYQFAQALPKGLMVILLKVGFFPGTSCSTFESNWWIVMIPRRP